MVIRNGILSTVRSRGRTILFALLIFLLTLSLSLGLGLWSYCAQTLAAMDATYTSIALVEYKGENYPDQYAADETARMAFAQLGDYSQVPGVELWEPTQRGFVVTEGYLRPDGTIPYKDQVVLTVVQATQKYEQEVYTVTEEELPFEFMLNALRLTAGVPKRLWTERTGLSYDVIADTVATLQKDGLWTKESDRIGTSPRGFAFLSSVQEAFL